MVSGVDINTVVMISRPFLALVVATAMTPTSIHVMAQHTNCTAVHMIVARASTEPPGTGIIGQVAQQVQAQTPGSDIIAVDYPATLSDYVNSESAGVTAMTKLVTDYATACPNSKLVLMGYSQVSQALVPRSTIGRLLLHCDKRVD